jgi:mRNA-degrading endonuclease RelE of RelBE toxin-antitoxin system
VTRSPVEIQWAAPARRAIAKLPEKVATAIVEFLYGSLAQNPHRVGRVLRLDLDGLHSARRGDYRVIFSIDEERSVVQVIAIEHRADAYRSRPERRPRT